MCILIKENHKTEIYDTLEKAKSKATKGDFIYTEHKTFEYPDYDLYNKLYHFFRGVRSKTKNNLLLFKKLQELTLSILIWENLK